VVPTAIPCLSQISATDGSVSLLESFQAFVNNTIIKVKVKGEMYEDTRGKGPHILNLGSN